MAETSQTIQNYGEKFDHLVQSDYQFSNNGYGLLQLTVRYDIDNSQSAGSADMFKRGGEFVEGTNTGQLAQHLKKKTWTIVKTEEVGRDGNLATVRTMYAAINDGDTTETEATITSSAVSEPIESHPNFSVIQIDKIANNGTSKPPKPLGGEFTAGSPPIIQNAEDPKNPFRAYWVAGQANPGVFPWQFQGFLPTTDNTKVNRKAGVKSWMRPTITMRLTAYTYNKETATVTAQKVGWALKGKSYGVFTIPEVYQGLLYDGLAKTEARNWLVTGTNLEVYGGMYKVTADLLMSGILGWDPDIYPYID